MLCADPNETYPFSLKSDRAKPADARPTFLFRALTCRESRAAYRTLKEATAKETSEDDAAAKLEAVIRIGLAGLRNVVLRGQPVDPAVSPLEYLTTGEAWELAYAVAAGGPDPEAANPLSDLPVVSASG